MFTSNHLKTALTLAFAAAFAMTATLAAAGDKGDSHRDGDKKKHEKCYICEAYSHDKKHEKKDDAHKDKDYSDDAKHEKEKKHDKDEKYKHDEKKKSHEKHAKAHDERKHEKHGKECGCEKCRAKHKAHDKLKKKAHDRHGDGDKKHDKKSDELHEKKAKLKKKIREKKADLRKLMMELKELEKKADKHAKHEKEKEKHAKHHAREKYEKHEKHEKKDDKKHTLAEVLAKKDEFSKLAYLAKKAGFDKGMKDHGKLTVFAPTDAAFSKVPEDVLEHLAADKEKLRKLLKAHIVEGKHSALDVLKKESLKTLAGSKLEASSKNWGVKVSGADIVKADIEASDGVIHAIDSVIRPPMHD